MSEQHTCPSCGAEMPANAPAGFCVPCLLRHGLDESPEKAQASNKAVLLPVAPHEKIGDTIGRYKLLEQLGVGGCGIVYLAEQKEPVRRQVALKVIKLGMDTEQVIARFEAERQALALMDHPNIAKVLDAGATETGRPYFVMELVSGKRITDYCDEHKLPTEERLELFIQVCQAIQHAHQKGIIHRDIKPSNILVVLNNGVPVPKVIDFGIAKATTGQPLTDKTIFTALEQFIGTPAYMSPEQAELRSLDIDTRSDIYALGVLLYELLTGRTPFDARELLAKGLDEVRRIIREEEPPRPSTRLSTLDADEQTAIAKRRQSEPPKLLGILRGDLDWIVMTCLEKERSRRYETADGLAMDIRRHLNTEPIVARPPSNFYRFHKLVRRNKLVFAAVSAIVGTLLLGVIVSTWQAVRATRAQKSADHERDRADRNAAAETRQRQSAEEAAQRANVALSTALEVEGDRLVREGAAGKSLAYFARALRLDPVNRVAAQRIVSLLNQRDFPIPLTRRPESFPFDSQKVLAYSGDWQRLCIYTNRSSLALIETGSGRAVGKPMPYHERILSIRLDQHGSRVAVGFTNRTTIWDCDSGREVLNIEGETEAFSPDGRLAVISNTVVEVDSGRRTFSLAEKGRSGEAATSPPAFSPDSQWLSFLVGSGEIEVFSATTGEQAMPPIPTPLRGPTPFARFTPDNRRLVIGGTQAGLAHVWDLTLHRQAFSDLRAGGTVWDVSFSRDGRLLATAARDGQAKLWSLFTGLSARESCLMPEGIGHVLLAPDGSCLLTVPWRTFSPTSGLLKYWDIRPGRAVPVTLFHPATVRSADYNSDGSLIVTVCDDGAARLWRSEDGTLLFSALVHGGRTLRAVFSPNSAVLATGTENGEVCLWDTKSGRLMTASDAHKAPITALAFTPDSRFLASGADDGSVKVREVQSGMVVAAKDGYFGTVLCLAMDPKGEKLVACFRDYRAEILEPSTLRVVAALTKNQGWVWHAQFSHDGRWLCTSSGGDATQLWDGISGAGPVRMFPHGAGVYTACFSADDNSVVTASYDGTARVWERASGRPRTEPLAHRGRVWSAGFSPDDQKVLTASEDGTAVVWDVRTGRALSEPFAHEGMLLSAHFSPDGKHVLTAGQDGLVNINDWIDVPEHPPSWLAEIAEAVGCYHLSERGVAEYVGDSAQILLDLKQRLDAGDTRSDSFNPLTKWGQWYLADRQKRTISPQARMTGEEYARTLAQNETLVALEEALDLGEQTPLVYRKLAAIVAASQPETAELYRRLAGEGEEPFPRAASIRASTVTSGRIVETDTSDFVDPFNVADLLKREGTVVKVKGRIVKFGSASRLYFLDFAENFRSALTLVFSVEQNPSEFRPETLKTYVNKTVVVEGKIINWKGAPEMEIKSLAEITEVEGLEPKPRHE